MLIHHPEYQNKIFAVFADSVVLGDDIPKDMQPAVRIQMKDYPKSKLKELVPFPGGKDIDRDIEDMDLLNEYGNFGTIEAIIGAFRDGRFMHEVESKLGKTTQELIDSDGNIIVLGLKEYDELF